ncbi:MAG: aldo/keto reductase [Planctomycetes bacterium]|nr:aldo/keto reductase [Planctomycetota bacterium]
MAELDHPFSLIGFGGFKIGRDQDFKYPTPYDLPDDASADRLLNGLLDLGINYIDTAPAYGSSEQRIGRAIGHRRREFLLSTKVGERWEHGRSIYDFSERAVRASIERSRNRLQVDTLDLVFVHANQDDRHVVQQTDVVPVLRALRDEGVVSAIGLSAYHEPAYRAALDWCDAIMVEYHLRDRSLEPIMTEARRSGIAVIVKKPLASGTLTPKEAFPFVLNQVAVSSIVVGSLSLDHLGENLRIARTIVDRRAQAAGQRSSAAKA